MKSSSFKLYIGLVAACVLLLFGAIGITQLGGNMLEQQGKDLGIAKVENAAANNRQDNLTRAQANIAKYENLYTIARGILPQEKDQARTVREIVSLAGQNGITLSQLSFPSSSLGNTKRGSASTSVDQTQLTPVKGSNGLYVMPITIASGSGNAVPYSQAMNFLRALQGNRLTANIQSVDANPSTENRNLISFSIVLNIYVRP